MSPGPSLATVIETPWSVPAIMELPPGFPMLSASQGAALLSVTGLVILIQEAPIIFRVLTWVGAIYLLWLGWQGVTAKRADSPEWKSNFNTADFLCSRGRVSHLSVESKNFSLFHRIFSQLSSGHQSLEFLHHGRHPNADRWSLVQPDCHFCFSKFLLNQLHRGLGGPRYGSSWFWLLFVFFQWSSDLNHCWIYSYP